MAHTVPSPSLQTCTFTCPSQPPDWCQETAGMHTQQGWGGGPSGVANGSVLLALLQCQASWAMCSFRRQGCPVRQGPVTVVTDRCCCSPSREQPWQPEASPHSRVQGPGQQWLTALLDLGDCAPPRRRAAALDEVIHLLPRGVPCLPCTSDHWRVGASQRWGWWRLLCPRPAGSRQHASFQGRLLTLRCALHANETPGRPGHRASALGWL